MVLGCSAIAKYQARGDVYHVGFSTATNSYFHLIFFFFFLAFCRLNKLVKMPITILHSQK